MALGAKLCHWEHPHLVPVLEMVGVRVVRVSAPVPEPTLMRLSAEGCVNFIVSVGYGVDLAHAVALASVRPTRDYPLPLR